MNRPVLIGAIAIGAFAAGAIYLTHEPAGPSTSAAESVADGKVGETAQPKAEAPQVPATGAATQPVRIAANPAPSDPRLAALAVSPDNGLIEFVAAPDGKVIKEIDKDPGSFGFKKPLREYTYRGEQVVGLISYQYFSDHVQITRTAVSYKPDGSVDQYQESTSYDYGSKQS